MAGGTERQPLWKSIDRDVWQLHLGDGFYLDLNTRFADALAATVHGEGLELCGGFPSRTPLRGIVRWAQQRRREFQRRRQRAQASARRTMKGVRRGT